MVNVLFSHLKKFFQHQPGNLPEPGLYHYARQWQGERSRIHLRVDPDLNGQGIHGILLAYAKDCRNFHVNKPKRSGCAVSMT